MVPHTRGTVESSLLSRCNPVVRAMVVARIVYGGASRPMCGFPVPSAISSPFWTNHLEVDSGSVASKVSASFVSRASQCHVEMEMVGQCTHARRLDQVTASEWQNPPRASRPERGG
jgi:hypothetical protein